MSNEDAAFWERIADMPAWEAEHECVLRRERLVLENAMLITAKAGISPSSKAAHKEIKAITAAIMDNSAQVSKLNERIKYLRKLQDRVNWKQAVSELFGQEAMEQCLIHMEMKWKELYDLRRQWAA